MTAHEEYSREKRGVDGFLSAGYIIFDIREDLDGATVRFQKMDSFDMYSELRLMTAEGRKYIAVRLIEQQDKKREYRAE